MGNAESKDMLPSVSAPTITDSLEPVLLIAAPSLDAETWRIGGTLGAIEEERRINDLIETGGRGTGSARGRPVPQVVVYGRNGADLSAESHARKLAKHGIDAAVYRGGLLEWALLHELYGSDPYRLDDLLVGGARNCDPLDFLA